MSAILAKNKIIHDGNSGIEGEGDKTIVCDDIGDCEVVGLGEGDENAGIAELLNT
jgi:hypothetical protein